MKLFKHIRTTYTLNGRRVKAGTPGATRQASKSTKWYARVTDEAGQSRKVPLSSDKAASQKMLAELLRKIERRKAGIETPEDAGAAEGIDQLLKDYEASQRVKENSEGHIVTVMGRLRAVVAGCKIRMPRDIDAARFVRWLEAETVGRPLSQQTAQYYRVNFRSFVRWLVKRRKLAADPLASLESGGTITERKVIRRAMASEELRAILAAAGKSSATIQGLDGAARRSLYLLALTSGLRAGAIRSLRVRDFDLAAAPPVVRVSKGADKSRKGRTQPLPVDAAAELAAYLSGLPAEAEVFPGRWHERAAEMLREDAQAAGVPVTIATADGESKLDFHTLRHCYLTNLSRAGVDLRTAQELAGHSTPLLTARYTHVNLDTRAAAVNRLDAFAQDLDAELPASIAGGESVAHGAATLSSAIIPTAEGSTQTVVPCVALRGQMRAHPAFFSVLPGAISCHVGECQMTGNQAEARMTEALNFWGFTRELLGIVDGIEVRSGTTPGVIRTRDRRIRNLAGGFRKPRHARGLRRIRFSAWSNACPSFQKRHAHIRVSAAWGRLTAGQRAAVLAVLGGRR